MCPPNGLRPSPAALLLVLPFRAAAPACTLTPLCGPAVLVVSVPCVAVVDGGLLLETVSSEGSCGMSHEALACPSAELQHQSQVPGHCQLPREPGRLRLGGALLLSHLGAPIHGP
jgi:hypothetical protein